MTASRYGSSIVANASITRPANTTAYAAGDVISDSTSDPTVLTFSDAARHNGGSGLIVSALLIDSANQGTAGDFELHLFDTQPTAMEDNAVYDPTDAELATLVGVITFDTEIVGDATSGAGGNQVFEASTVNNVFVAPTGDLYGILLARNVYTPVSGEVFTIRLGILRD